MDSRASDDEWRCIEPIVEQIAAVRQLDPIDLPPLFDSVDPDALGSLLASADDSLRVDFTHFGCDITVENGGGISVQLSEGELTRSTR